MRLLVGPAFVAVGILHFVIPRQFEAIVPPYLPAHRELVYASGVTELAGALGSMHPRTRRAGGMLQLATLIGVFPANVDMAINADKYPEIPEAALWARLPLQALFVFFIVRATADDA